MKKYFLFTFLITVLFSACKQEEIFINEYPQFGKYLFSSENKIYQYLPETKTVEIILNSLPSSVSKIKYFRGYYYLLLPDAKSIYIIREKTFEIVSKVDYSFLDITPIDICFPNATDAYVLHNESQVTILDLTNFKVANAVMKIGKAPAAIAGAGNQVYICCQGDDMIYTIDTRTNSVVNTIKVSTSPSFLEFNYEGTTAFIVCTGADISSGEKTQAVVEVVDVSRKEVIDIIRLGYNEFVAKETLPTGIAVSSKNVYISASNNIWRLSLPSAKLSSVSNKTPCKSVGYDKKHNEFYLLRDDSNSGNDIDLIIYDNSNNKKKYTYSISQNIGAIISQ